jgi:hypothetical protein
MFVFPFVILPSSFPRKAPEDWRSPRRFADYENHPVARSALGCGGPPPLFIVAPNRKFSFIIHHSSFIILPQ